MQAVRRFFSSVADDLRNREHLETYLLIVLVIALFILDLFGEVLDDDRKLTLIIAALLVLIFRTRKELKVDDVRHESDRVIAAMNGLIHAPVELDTVLQDRQSYAPFREFVHDATVLWVYGASGINVLKNTKDINNIVSKPSGQLRVIVQDPSQAASMDILHQQLDKYNNLQSDIQSTMYTLGALARQYSGKMEHRLLDYSPGFSLLVVDPDGPNGRLSVEFYGYRNNEIEERMHIIITRQQSQYWFEYWAKQFQIMWDNAKPPVQP
jgi:hypothetical protein